MTQATDPAYPVGKLITDPDTGMLHNISVVKYEIIPCLVKCIQIYETDKPKRKRNGMMESEFKRTLTNYKKRLHYFSSQLS